MSFKPEISVDGGLSFHQNNLAFATKEEAEASARDTFGRWMLATGWQVVESDQPVNYQIVDGVMSPVQEVADAH